MEAQVRMGSRGQEANARLTWHCDVHLEVSVSIEPCIFVCLSLAMQSLPQHNPWTLPPSSTMAPSHVVRHLPSRMGETL
jgi:hypothetical protein